MTLLIVDEIDVLITKDQAVRRYVCVCVTCGCVCAIWCGV